MFVHLVFFPPWQQMLLSVNFQAAKAGDHLFVSGARPVDLCSTGLLCVRSHLSRTNQTECFLKPMDLFLPIHPVKSQSKAFGKGKQKLADQSDLLRRQPSVPIFVPVLM